MNLNQTFISVSLDARMIEKKKFDTDSISIGRDIENDLYINNLAVSRFHAKIYREGPKIIIKDLGSANGTYVNGKKIEWANINIGDIIMVGKHTLTLDQSTKIQDEAFTEGHTVMVDQNTQDKLLRRLESQNSPGNSKLIGSGGIEIPIQVEYFTIGKNPDANVNLNELFVKDIHASIVRQSDGNYRIINSGSFFKPTKINGKKIHEQILNSGDVIQIGNHKMVFVL